MHYRAVVGITGILLVVFSLTLLVPIFVALVYGESTIPAFGAAFGITMTVGLICCIAYERGSELHSREGFLITVLFYIILGSCGAIPLWLASGATETFTDAAFESFSGLTTTGATVLTGIDELPRSILFYRQQLQWLGGMGIIVLAVAILPMLRVGGMQLYRTEIPGNVKDRKIKPRIAETAKVLWSIYIGMTAICTVCYWIAGMSLFDAICHAFSTVAIGGFSTHDQSIGFFDSVFIESIAVVFMLLSGINFGLHYVAIFHDKRLKLYKNDDEVRLYISFIFAVTVIVLSFLFLYGAETGNSLREGIFHTVSIATTTGFTTSDYAKWPLFVPVLLLSAAFVGGCAGSTAGGIKVYRILLIFRQGIREIRRLIHPRGIFHIKLNGRLVPDRVVDAVWGFFAVYFAILVILVLTTLATSGMDFLTAFSAVGACLNNLGPGLGEVALNYQSIPSATKWTLILAMLFGRLEIFTLLVLVAPGYWRG